METNRYLGVVLPMSRYTSELDDMSKMCGYQHNYFNENGIKWRLYKELSWENTPDGNDVSWLLLRSISIMNGSLLNSAIRKVNKEHCYW